MQMGARATGGAVRCCRKSMETYHVVVALVKQHVERLVRLRSPRIKRSHVVEGLLHHQLKSLKLGRQIFHG